MIGEEGDYWLPDLHSQLAKDYTASGQTNSEFALHHNPVYAVTVDLGTQIGEVSAAAIEFNDYDPLAHFAGNVAGSIVLGKAVGGKRVSDSAKSQATKGADDVIALTKARFGHTFTTHGQDATEFLMKRAAGSGKPMGQFLDDQAAARLIQDNLGKLKNGAISVPVPKGFPARVIMPDGSFAPASSIRLVPRGTGVKTAYPEL